MSRILPLLLALAVATPALAGSTVQTVISGIGDADAAGQLPVELTLLNGGDTPAAMQMPARIPAEVTIGGQRTSVVLDRLPGTPATVVVPAGAFAHPRYGLRLPASNAAGVTAILSVSEWGPTGIAFAVPAEAQAAKVQTADAAPVVEQSFGSADADTGNAFLRGLSAYEPIYGVIGSGTDTEARLQFSLKYQLFGEGGAVGGTPSILDGLYFGYTQKMYWDLRAPSSPLRDVDYMPELFYLVPGRVLFEGISLGGQAGVRHESNGRDGAASRSLNTAYIQPVATTAIGRYKLSLGPRVWTHVGQLSDNPDIRRYRGNSGLFAEFGRDDGLRLSTVSRYNFGSGKGSVDADLSYPLNRVITQSLNLYVFVQGFAGYGESLLDYDRRTTRLRMGIGIVR